MRLVEMGVELTGDRDGPWTLVRDGAGPRLGWGHLEHAKAAHAHGYDTVVLCAREWQDVQSPEVELVRVPNDDVRDLPSDGHWRWRMGIEAGRLTKRVRNGRRVLVTCAAGINRSALLAALTYRGLTGRPGSSIVREMRMLRSSVLSNDGFVQWLDSLGAYAPDGVRT